MALDPSAKLISANFTLEDSNGAGSDFLPTIALAFSITNSGFTQAVKKTEVPLQLENIMAIKFYNHASPDSEHQIS